MAKRLVAVPVVLTTSKTTLTEPYSERNDLMHSFGNKSEIQRKWHGIIDSLETFYKDRLSNLRKKVD